MTDKHRSQNERSDKSKLLPKSFMKKLSIDNKAEERDKFLLTDSDFKPSFEKNKADKNKRLRWFCIVLSWFTIFASTSQFTMFSGILGPYLSILDPGISKDFAPWTVMAFSFGQMTAPIFGWWSNKIKKCRPPILTGLIIIIIGTVAFLCLELFPVYTRKWALFTIRILIGFGSGILCVCRSYCATASTNTERSIAIVGSTAALGLAVIAGPGAQGLFALVDYPGVYLSVFHLHMYNAPAVTSAVFAMVLLVLNATVLLEEYPGVEKAMVSTNGNGFNSRALPKYNKFGAFLLIWCWFCCWTMLTTFIILGIPFTQSQFDWSLSEALLYNGAIFGFFAAISLVVYTIYAIYGPRFDDNRMNIVGMFLMLAFWLLTFPYPGYPMPDLSHSSNETTNLTSTCKFTPQQWCFNTSRIPVAMYLVSIAFLAAGFPICNSALSAMLPKLIGPRRMGLMQGLYVTTGSIGRLLGPLFISFVFAQYGPRLSWSIPVALIISGILLATIFQKHLVPLNPNPKLKPGDFYHYKQGVVYRF